MVQKLSLATMTLLIESKKVYTGQGVRISVTGVAQASNVLAVKPEQVVLPSAFSVRCFVYCDFPP
jgi:hypothetical protein